MSDLGSEPGAVSDLGSNAVHRGVRWQRDEHGNVSFYDQSTRQWVQWAPGVDAPPMPPRWSLLGVPTRVTRPGWRSRWRLVPLVLVVAAVVVAVLQAVTPSGNNTAKERAAAEALLGKCLAQVGPTTGQPRYSTNAVDCASSKAAVKVVQVIPAAPDGSGCPAATTGIDLGYAVLCLQALHPARP